MKRIVTLCCVFLTLTAAVCAQGGVSRAARAPQAAAEPLPLDHGGVIETNYDGFEHETVVELKRMKITCAVEEGSESVKGVCVNLQAALHCPGKQLDYVRRATIRLTFETKNWDRLHPPEERDLTAVADGETLRLGRMALVSKGVGEGWVEGNTKETLEAAVPYETFLKLARAAYVEFSVGKTSFALRDKNVAALRDMNNRVKLPPVSGAGGN
ncbi:MAG TPA: hypothetical protein VE642_11845 [Pyrinomonadaceae bacterium]|jgi:hypothetical protein|nr:hypothetical protein [Pyrinomonadaceae bacterium]